MYGYNFYEKWKKSCEICTEFQISFLVPYRARYLNQVAKIVNALLLQKLSLEERFSRITIDTLKHSKKTSREEL